MSLYDGDFCVRLIAMPLSIRAQTRLDCDGFYNIYINCLLPYHRQVAAFWHEARHILRNDFWNDTDIAIAESA